MPYIGAAWEQRGGNDRDATYLNNLQKWASTEGLLYPRNAQQLPEETQSVLAKLVDFVSREEYAMASIFDTLAGTGQEGEGVGHRFVRELIGGTRLGNALGLTAGDKETWDRVLEQQGVGVGGRLSDLVGENRVTKYFDPSIRGTGAMGLSVLTSPSTYVGIGLGGKVAKVMGKGGEVALSSAGEKLLTQRYFRSLGRLAQKHGIDASEGIAKVEREVLKAEAKSRSLTYMREWGEEVVANELRKKAGNTIARGIERGIIDSGEATIRSAVRFGDLGLFGSSVRGVELFGTNRLTAPFRATGNLLERAARQTRLGGRLIDDINAKATAFHDFFNAVPRLATKVPGLKRLIQNRDAQIRGSVALAEDLVNEAVFGSKKAFRKLDDDALKALGDAVEGVRVEDWYAGAKRAGFDAEWADGVLKNWNDFAEEMGAGEALRGMQDAERVAALKGRYIPHIVTGLTDEQRTVLFKGYVNRGIGTGDVGRFAEARYFDTRDELRAFLAANKDKFPDAQMVESAHELMVRRTAANLAGHAEADFADDLLALYQATPERVFRSFYDEVGRQATDPTRGGASFSELETAEGILRRSSSYAGEEAKAARRAGAKAAETTVEELRKADIEALRSMRPDLRAAVVQEMFSRVKTLDHFDNLLTRYASVLDSMGLNRSQYATGITQRGLRSVVYQGQTLVDHEFKRGRLAGRKAVLPRAVVDSLERMEERYLDNPELSQLLRTYDRAHNAFKFSVTSLFPAFNTRNAYSNVFASMLDIGVTALNPAVHLRAIRVMLGDDVTIRTAMGQSVPAAAIRRSARALGIWQENLAFADLSPTRSVLSEIEANNFLARARRAVTTPARGIENEARMMHYIAAIERGQSFQDAARATKQFLFDYEDLSDNEKKIMRRVFSFYTWQRKAVELHVRQAIMNPGRVLAGIRLTDNERGPGPDYLPEFVRGDLKMKLLKQPGKADTFLTGIDLPVGSVNALWSGGVGLTLRENVSMLTPFLKNPLEYALDSQAMGAHSIKGRQFLGRLGPAMQRRFPQWAKDYVELKEVGSGDRKYYTANGTKVWAVLKAPFIARLVSDGVTAEEVWTEFRGGRGGGAQLLRLLSGLSLREYDLTDAQRMEMRNKIRRMEQLLLDSGEAAEFRRVYDPEARKKKSNLFGSLYGGTQ